MILTLPYPPGILNPNNRKHWRAKAPIRAKYKDDCYLLALANKPTLQPGNIALSITFNPPTLREPDLDNLLSALKNGLDGVATAWGINDKMFRPITVHMGSKVKDGSVVISIDCALGG